MGKIHGSLTRAGKVKNLTKFVRKGPKKIKKRGRKKYRKLSSRIKNFIRILLR
uniref:40S ribosomal protein S30 n=1 Tax=Lotharella vacuolata TaxID=74820 RepID=A0A0H5BGX2_9EUKA|nr:ribosomal protein S30 [Lotharella vacuolata]